MDAITTTDEGWHLESHGYRPVKIFERRLLGHVLMVEPTCSGDHCPVNLWFKWLDGHFRGTASALREAEFELEREAQALDTAWKRKLAWNGVERRRHGRLSLSAE